MGVWGLPARHGGPQEWLVLVRGNHGPSESKIWMMAEGTPMAMETSISMENV